jgi:hypothetical protein
MADRFMQWGIRQAERDNHEAAQNLAAGPRVDREAHDVSAVRATGMAC